MGHVNFRVEHGRQNSNQSSVRYHQYVITIVSLVKGVIQTLLQTGGDFRVAFGIVERIHVFPHVDGCLNAM